MKREEEKRLKEEEVRTRPALESSLSSMMPLSVATIACFATLSLTSLLFIHVWCFGVSGLTIVQDTPFPIEKHTFTFTNTATLKHYTC